MNGAQLLVLFSGVLAFAALALAFMGWRAGRNELVVERLLGRQEAVAVRPRSSHWLARQMRRAGIQRPRPWLFGAAVLALLLVWSGLRLFGIVGALGGLLLAALSCRVALGMLYQRRLKRMIRQMPRFLDQVVRSLHAGRTLGDALMQAVENAEEPLRDIFTLARNHVLRHPPARGVAGSRRTLRGGGTAHPRPGCLGQPPLWRQYQRPAGQHRQAHPRARSSAGSCTR